MSRRAAVVDRVIDIYADAWDVREHRTTAHGWPLSLGWPAGVPRGKGGAGGPRAIVTPRLADYLRATVASPRLVQLPIGRTAILRLRRLVGVSAVDERIAWWDERIGDLMRLTYEQFAARHDVAVSTVSLHHVRLFGPRKRAAGWWREPQVVEALQTLPTAVAGDRLDLAASSVRRLRAELNLGR